MRFRSLIVTCLVSLVPLGIAATSAQAETTGPVWKVISVANPTNFKPSGENGTDALMVIATNVGGASTGCTAEQIAVEPRPLWSPIAQCPAGSPVVSPITISDALPAGLTAVEIVGDNAYHDPQGKLAFGNPETIYGGLNCSLAPAPHCVTSEPVDPGDTLVITIRVDVDSAPPATCSVPAEATSCVTNSAAVSGGGAANASVSSPVTISSATPPYGIASGSLFAATSTSQAGAHPNVTTGYFLNTTNPSGEKLGAKGGLPTEVINSEPVTDPKDVGFDLPPGLVGTTVGMARCTMAEVANSANCPRDTMVGTATLILSPNDARWTVTVPVFNIAPAPGEPAAFAFNAVYFSVRLDTSVLSDGDYGVRVTAPNLTVGGKDYASFITIWGVPAEHNGPGPDAAARNGQAEDFLSSRHGRPPEFTFGGRGVEEREEEVNGLEKTVTTPFETRVPLLTNPSQCSGPLKGVLETDSWEAEGVFPGGPEDEASMGTDTGCNLLSFKPSVSMLPDTLEAGAPAGYAFDLSVPQNTEAEGLATPDLKRTSVTLPAGTVISPSAADGLGVCTNEQFFGAGPREAKPATPGACPRDSQVGEVSIETPALEKALTGDVYLAAPECSPCTPQDAATGKMIRLFVQVVGKGEDGIVVKLEGTGQIDQETGQLTTTFENTPQLPFSNFELKLQGGERATLANPRTCGEVSTTADLTPWSSPFTPDASPTSNFDVDENCFGPQFNPSFSASTTSVRAGEFTPFTLSFGRSDSDEFLNGGQFQLPPGLLGMISKVKLCEEPQANAGTCSSESQIGEVTVQTGPGADPFLVKGGKVYITGPYKGAPYGLSIVVPAKAGPYTLSGTTGNGTVVNRSAISVNPETSALTVTSDPLPTELDGIPLQLRLVNVTINRPEFTFNPTNCDNPAVTGTLTSTEAASAHVSSSLQILDCAKLAFKPKFTASTSGKTSKAVGASLDAKVSYPYGPQGTYANIAKFKVDLPKQLPSRLTTLQKACLAKVFEANPANCPAASNIGIVKASTPVLPVPPPGRDANLTGPVYFVSHGGEAFPSLVVVLQGDGVRVDLTAATFISKKGITSSTFNTIPDVPVTSFELYLPEGKYSALAANGNLCKSSLAMPTAIVAQNGAQIHQSTKIAVTGCPKLKAAVKKKKAKVKKGKKASDARLSPVGGKSSINKGGRS